MSAELPKMPEPAGYQYRNKKTGRASVVGVQMDMSLRGGEDYTEQRLFTESQMRTFAQEAARQAMERTLSICRQMEERGYDAKDCAEAIEDAIRALLPPTSPTSEENGNG